MSWNNKYRPKKLDELFLNDILFNKISNFINNKEISNIIISGHPGTGKTSSIVLLSKLIYAKYKKKAIIKLNASYNRGLNTINNSIVNFCKKKIELPNNLSKLIILDEADNITNKAQYSLINLMDKYKETTKFAFTCNDSNNIIEGIQSRCIILYYNKIDNNNIKKKLKNICNKEKIKFTIDGLETIVNISDGDMRKAINYLEMIYNGFNIINNENIYKICDKPNKNHILKIFDNAKKNNLKNIFDIVLKLRNDGYCNNDIIMIIINVIKKEKIINEKIKIKLLDSLYDSLVRISNGYDTKLQLLYCINKVYKIYNKN